MTPFNPLQRFKQEMIEGFRALNYRYLVTQTYMRGQNPLDEHKKPILLTPYDDIGLASEHLGAIFADPFKSTIDLENPTHLKKLEQMCRPESPYTLFIALIKDAGAVNLRNNKVLAEAVRKYVTARTGWSVDRAETVAAKMQLRFGEFFLSVSYKGETITERLCVFEHANLDGCATIFPSLRVFR